MRETCCAVIVAAGNSTRMGKPKIFLPLCGRPALEWTLRAFQEAVEIHSVVIVLRPEEEHVATDLAKKCLKKPFCIVSGGSTRQQSAAAGVSAAQGARWIAVHDGARCLITPEEIDSVVKDAKKRGAAALAVPVKDTIKTVDGERMISFTPDRSCLWSMQTPQVFPTEAYQIEIQKAQLECREYTDDCQLWEHAGYPVHLCQGSYSNIKLTTEEDITVAESILKKRRQCCMRIGHGYDVHRLVKGRKLILGGVHIPWEMGLLGHSDADVLAHAVIDSLLGAAALGDIGLLFPDSDPSYKDANSLKLLQKAAQYLYENGWGIENIDVTVLAQAPKLRPYIQQIQENIAKAVEIPAEQISIKATTEEGLGFTGKGEGLACHAVCLIEKR